MRKIILAASAGALGFLVAAAPASALSSYTINTDGGSNFSSTNLTPPPRQPVTVTTSSSFGYDSTSVDMFNSQDKQQQDLSRDMSWQGTGYYLRPNR